MQRQLSTGDKKLIDLLKYVKYCQCVSQRLKDAERAKVALKQYTEECIAAVAIPARKATTAWNTTTPFT